MPLRNSFGRLALISLEDRITPSGRVGATHSPVQPSVVAAITAVAISTAPLDTEATTNTSATQVTASISLNVAQPSDTATAVAIPMNDLSLAGTPTVAASDAIVFNGVSVN